MNSDTTPSMEINPTPANGTAVLVTLVAISAALFTAVMMLILIIMMLMLGMN